MDGDFWFRMAGLMAFFVALFVVPIVTLMRDDRQATKARSDRTKEPTPAAEHSA